MADLVVPVELVPDLRCALLRLLGSAAERLAMISLPGRLTHLPSYESALWTVQAAGAILEKVGVVETEQEHAVSLSAGEYPLLLSRALRQHHESLRRRKQDDAISRGAPLDSSEDELGVLVTALRRRCTGGTQEDEERRLLSPYRAA